MNTLIVRPANHADLPSLLDLCIHRDPEDGRCAPKDVGAALDYMLRYKGIGGMHPVEPESAGLGRELAHVRLASDMPSKMQSVSIG